MNRVVFGGTETVSGSVEISVPTGKKLEHLGIKIEMIGLIELYFDRSSTLKFTTLVRELESAGVLASTKVIILFFNNYNYIYIDINIYNKLKK